MYIYVIIKTTCPPCYHHNAFPATHALGHMIAQVQKLLQSHCGDNEENALLYYSHLTSVKFYHFVSHEPIK